MNYLDPAKLETLVWQQNQPKMTNKPSCTTIMKVAILAFVAGLIISWLLFGGTVFKLGRKGSSPEFPEAQIPTVGEVDYSANVNFPADSSGPSAAELRLPTDLKPVQYELGIKTYLPGYIDVSKEKNLTFDAVVAIEMVVESETNTIVLNAKNLNFDMKKVILSEGDSHSSNNIALKEKFVTKEHEKVTFVAEKTFAKGQKLLLIIEYSGYINNDMGGLYQNIYLDADGTRKIAAATQMEATDARQMVPCFDEPDYKAVWKVSVIHPKGTTALSNGIEIGTENSNGDPDFLVTSFKETPPMSSYLLAFVVSEFAHIEGKSENGIRFRVYARPEAIESARFALEAGLKCITFYEKWFNIPFPLEKQDMVALPDFAAGAMENWGLITYRETALLYDDRVAQKHNKYRVAEVVAHELAHMWFGNLVTMQWWDDLWLNEGFASFVELFGGQEIFDNKDRMKVDQIQSDTLYGAKDADSYATAHPLSFKIDKSKEVDEAFDAISYSKGASIMNMLREAMGQENFDAGITNYLNTHNYNNAKAPNLWAALNKHVPDSKIGPNGKKLDIQQFASQWTDQMGYPTLYAERVNSSHVKISQHRFLKNNETQALEKYAKPEYGFKWDVPVWYQVGTNDRTEFAWLSRDEDLLIRSEHPIILNAEGNGFYRQNYAPDYWMEIAKILETEPASIQRHTRFNLILDAFEMASIGELDYKDLFEIVKYAPKEQDKLVSAAIRSGFSEIAGKYGTELEGQDVRMMIRKMTEKEKKFKSFDSEDKDDWLEAYLNHHEHKESHSIHQKTVTIQKDVCTTKDCHQKMQTAFNENFVDNCTGTDLKASECNNLPAKDRFRVYCWAVQNGNGKTFNTIMEYYKKETVQLEIYNLLDALACTKSSYTLKSILKAAMDRNSTLIRFQDVPRVFSLVQRHAVGSIWLFNYFLEHWDQIYDSFHARTSILESVVIYATRGIRTPYQLHTLKYFYQTKKTAQEFSIFRKRLDHLGHTVQWNQRFAKEVHQMSKKYLENHSE